MTTKMKNATNKSPQPAKNKKLIVATTSLAGCFGCHMSFLDIDEKLFDLIELVEFNKSPFDDIKTFTKECDVGLIEGGCCNEHNVHVLREFRKKCKILISVGQCAITGGLPAMRNGISMKDLFAESYQTGITVHNALIPNDEEIPALLNRVYPCHEIVKIDAFLPGCAPRAEVFWSALTSIINNKGLDSFSYDQIQYDYFKYD